VINGVHRYQIAAGKVPANSCRPVVVVEALLARKSAYEGQAAAHHQL
jgi:hypothetical protein